jgi:aspartyl-tRNA(Asn)/glutamyl-tRNA(Gln) amidotransferase subunit B
LLTNSRSLADFFEATLEIRGRDRETAKNVANWILRDVLQLLKERDVEIDALALTPEGLAALMQLVEEGRLTARSARELFEEVAENGADPEVLMRERGLEAVSDSGLIEQMVDEVIAANEKAAQAVRDGEDKQVNFLMGQVMKKSQGKANPGQVRDLLLQKLQA